MTRIRVGAVRCCPRTAVPSELGPGSQLSDHFRPGLQSSGSPSNHVLCRALHYGSGASAHQSAALEGAARARGAEAVALRAAWGPLGGRSRAWAPGAGKETSARGSLAGRPVAFRAALGEAGRWPRSRPVGTNLILYGSQGIETGKMESHALGQLQVRT